MTKVATELVDSEKARFLICYNLWETDSFMFSGLTFYWKVLMSKMKINPPVINATKVITNRERTIFFFFDKLIGKI